MRNAAANSKDMATMRRPVAAFRNWIAAALVVMWSTSAALAHPHVWVTMTEELIYSGDGALTGIRHMWTFDEMFSSYAVQGIPAKIKGNFTRHDLKDLAQTNVEALKEYQYFTSARIDGKKQIGMFGDPTDYWLDYDPSKTELTLHFILPVKAPKRVERLVLEIYDPEFFVDFGLSDSNAIKLIGAPEKCTFTTQKPHDSNFVPAQRTDNTSEVNAGMGASFANKIAVQCP